MLKRAIALEIEESLAYFPVVGIIGPRQVGKTTLAKSLKSRLKKELLYLDLELEEDVFKLSNAQLYLQSHEDKCVVIDEIQLMPRLFGLIRALVDQKRVPARFILLGSASPEMIRGASESLAGRIAYHELTPLGLHELLSSSIKIKDHWFRGGFPDALLAPNLKIWKTWMRNFGATFIDKDLNDMGYGISKNAMTSLYKMLSFVHGQQLNISTISRSLGVTSPTVARYLDLLEGGFLINRLQSYHVNIGKRLVKSPKIYFRDSGILHQIAQIGNYEKLFVNPLIGASWEGYVIEQLKRAFGENYNYFYYRTQVGAEVDLLIQGEDERLFFIEVKFSLTPKISRGFRQSVIDLKPSKQYIIIPEGMPYIFEEDIVISGLREFLTTELPMLKA